MLALASPIVAVAQVEKLKQLYLFNTRGAKKLLIKQDNKFADEAVSWRCPPIHLIVSLQTPEAGREERVMSATKAPVIQGACLHASLQSSHARYRQVAWSS